jgi:hypothetical protein
MSATANHLGVGLFIVILSLELNLWEGAAILFKHKQKRPYPPGEEPSEQVRPLIVQI